MIKPCLLDQENSLFLPNLGRPHIPLEKTGSGEMVVSDPSVLKIVHNIYKQVTIILLIYLTPLSSDALHTFEKGPVTFVLQVLSGASLNSSLVWRARVRGSSTAAGL